MSLHDLFNECLDIDEEYIHVENDGDFFIERDGTILRIFFEKSDSKADWENNFKFLAIPKKPYKNMKKTWFCHRGFSKVWDAIEPYVKDEIMNPDNDKIEIVGYSHGGGVALLCYEYCVFHRPDIDVIGFGFGAPRVLWGIIPKQLKKRLSSFYVVRNISDIVTHLPPLVFGYRNAPKLIKIGKPFKYNPIKAHTPEAYINELQNF